MRLATSVTSAAVLALFAASASASTPAATPATDPACGGSACSVNPACPCISLGAVSGYNLVVLGDLNGPSSDVEGAVAVGGNATLTNFSVGLKLPASPTPTALVVGGNLNFNGGSIYGNSYVGGTPTYTQVNFANGGSANAGSIIDFAATATRLLSLSDSLAAQASNGTTTNSYGSISLTGTDARHNYFTISGAALASANSITITVPAGSMTIVNVDGAADVFQNMGVTLVGGDKKHTLFNFNQATSLGIHGIGVPGTVLAPRAAVVFSGSNVDGTLIAGSLAGMDGSLGQVNYFPLTTCTTP